ncbi:MAG: hypothetical protein ABR576_13570 [Thermoanaerobaculia bacterium]
MNVRNTLSIMAAAFLALALPAAAATQNQVLDLVNILSGTWQGSTPGNELRLDIRSVTTDPSHPYDLFLSVSGKFGETNVRQQGLIRLESQGRSVYFGYIPHFDPTVTALSPNAARFTSEEANAACGFHLKPEGDGFTGETVGSSCVRAIRGSVGKWILDMEPGSIRLQHEKSGETLRFKRISKG